MTIISFNKEYNCEELFNISLMNKNFTRYLEYTEDNKLSDTTKNNILYESELNEYLDFQN
uniref:Uncharacterized protein n=1 Tax=Pithovirus LCDPAC02 TaxID=2506601 RepID=A0A481YP76_9VIRU|nr:MAG: hypothetical protein LCDPAC02_02700 [Pithovirus LCDPAC02]